MASSAALAPHPMFSQRGFTCGPDVLFTVLFESDALRTYFAPFLERSPARLLASKDQLKRALGLAIQRYMKMISAPPKSPYLLRTESTNTGEGREVLDIFSECGPEDIGMRPGYLKKVIREIFLDDAFMAFDSKHPIRVLSLPDARLKHSIVDKDRVFALIFELDYYPPVPRKEYNSNSENEERRRGGINLSRKTSGGHIVAFFKRGGVWYFADNEVGWLHAIKDGAFVAGHVIKGIQDQMGGGTFSPLILGALDESINPDVTHLRHTIIASDGATYTGTEVPCVFRDDLGYFATGEVHVFMTVGGGRRGRSRRGRSRRRRTQKK